MTEEPSGCWEVGASSRTVPEPTDLQVEAAAKAMWEAGRLRPGRVPSALPWDLSSNEDGQAETRRIARATLAAAALVASPTPEREATVFEFAEDEDSDGTPITLGCEQGTGAIWTAGASLPDTMRRLAEKIELAAGSPTPEADEGREVWIIVDMQGASRLRFREEAALSAWAARLKESDAGLLGELLIAHYVGNEAQGELREAADFAAAAGVPGETTELRAAAREVLNCMSHDTRMPRRFRVVALGALDRLEAALAVPLPKEETA